MRFSLAFYTLVILLSGCQPKSKPASLPAAGATPQPDSVTTLVLTAEAVRKDVTLPAELLPYERVQLYAKVPGFVRRMSVDIGSRVQKGQLLAVVDAPELGARVAEGGANVQTALVRYQNGQDLYRRLAAARQAAGAVSVREVESARNQMRADSTGWVAARQVLRSLRDQQAYLTLRAPFTGVVTRRSADPGALVGISQPLLELENNRRLRLRVAVPEALTGSRLPANRVSFTVKAFPGQAFAGALDRKSETIDPKTRTELWEFRVDNASGTLKAGMFADAKLGMARSQNSFLVPPTAVVTSLERKFVIRVKGGKTEWVDVATGLGVGDRQEVFGPLANGDTLLKAANEERKPDQTVIAVVK
ncbi:efflux RND transporter periplasmic adaptor subunit [Spirosoma utsteinense]|uniref:RND family efflux transporter MFP subunit n=1 Tax=Spirosoma utsteinense TaxID=2585773 RepID=A0ABR6WEQ1_9BACT|nr:efflux RND transporter periplasmic adaptor subunit [Spirosoma utsteinense]MBC3788441.1 RND family efflux transporter MFP subunit [Spirosoma utsteinense]MBC3795007.1 RND family efflux transporter MFP subunit [Spirosoma utsteinense]